VTDIESPLGPIQRRLDELVALRTRRWLFNAEQEEYNQLLAAEVNALAQRCS